MKNLVKWGAIGFGGIIVLLVIVAIFAPEPEEAADAPSSGRPVITPTPERRSDYVEFGIDEDPASDDLGLVGVSKTFSQGIDVWHRVILRKSAGKARWEFFLQRQEGAGWSTIDTWNSTSDPDFNILLGQVSALQRLDPGDYQVFVLIGDEKRAEGSFTILPVATPGKPTPTSTLAVTPAPIAEATTAAEIQATTQEVPTPMPEPTRSGPRTEFGDGTWFVGSDIAPGVYRIEGGDNCSWARLSGFGGETSEIIAIEIPVGPSVVAISPTDKGFQSKRCGNWVMQETP